MCVGASVWVPGVSGCQCVGARDLWVPGVSSCISHRCTYLSQVHTTMTCSVHFVEPGFAASWCTCVKLTMAM